MEYKPVGVCSQLIRVDVEDNVIKDTQGVARLVIGMNVDEAISRLEGIKCGFKSTSCPDQLAQALKAVSGK